MNKELADRTELFAANRLLMQQGFTWEYPAMNGLVAMLYTVYKRPLDIDLIRSCRRVMRPRLAEQGFLEGPGIIAASAMISLADDPVEAYHNTNKLYNMFLQKGFKPSLYILLASINIAKHHVDGEFTHMVEKAENVYKYLESIDSVKKYGLNQTYKQTLAATFSNVDARTYSTNASKYYSLVRKGLPTDNAAYILTDTILVGEKDREEKCALALQINDMLREHGYEWKEDFQFAILGILATLGVHKKVMLEDILEVVDYLQNSKLMSGMRLQPDHYLTYACLLTEIVLIENMPDVKLNPEQFEKLFVDMNIALIVNMVEEAPFIGNE